MTDALAALPPKRAAFVVAYTDPASPAFGNGTQAAIAAGYSSDLSTAGVTASRLLADASVKSAAQSAFAKAGLTDSWLATRLRYFAEDSDASWKRAPAVRATEIAARVTGAVAADTVSVTVDARSARISLVPGTDDPDTLLAEARELLGS